MSNYFSPQQPVDPMFFCGYEDHIEDLLAYFQNRTPRNVALFGLPSSGKTSILNYIASSIPNESRPDFRNFVRVRVDANGLGPHSEPWEFWYRVMSELAEKGDSKNLRDYAANRAIELESNKQSPGERFFDRLKRILGAESQRIIICIDDFHILLTAQKYLFNVSNFFSQFRVLGQDRQSMVNYLIVLPRSARLLWDIKQGSDWHNAVQSVYIPQLKVTGIHKIINKMLTSEDQKPADDLELKLAEKYSHHQPHLVQAIGTAVLEYRTRQKDSTLEDYIIKCIRHPTQNWLDNVLFRYYTPSEREAYLKLRRGEPLEENEHKSLRDLADSNLLLPGVEVNR